MTDMPEKLIKTPAIDDFIDHCYRGSPDLASQARIHPEAMPRENCISVPGCFIFGRTGPAGGASIMEVTYVQTADALIVAPVGRVDESTWKEFDNHLATAVLQASRESLGTLIIDLSRIDYMSSRGLRALTMASQQGRAVEVTIRLASPNDVMREILAISRYDRLFDVDDALPVDTGGGS